MSVKKRKSIVPGIVICLLAMGICFFHAVDLTAEPVRVSAAEDLTDSLDLWRPWPHISRADIFKMSPVYFGEPDDRTGEESIACDITFSGKEEPGLTGYAELRWTAPEGAVLPLADYEAVVFAYKISLPSGAEVEHCFFRFTEDWQKGFIGLKKKIDLIGDGQWHTVEFPLAPFSSKDLKVPGWNWQVKAFCLNFYLSAKEINKEMEATVYFGGLHFKPKSEEEISKNKQARNSIKKKFPAYLVFSSTEQDDTPEIKIPRKYGSALPDVTLSNQLEKLGFKGRNVVAFSPKLTLDYLKQFNVVILGAGGEGGQRALSSQMSKDVAKLLLEYVKQGGGLFLMRCPGWQFGKDIEAFNEWMEPTGIEILHEQMLDKDNVVKLPSKAVLFWTDNVAKHPVTDGVEGIFYPDVYSDGYRRYTDFSSPIKASDKWQTLLYGKKSAKSLRTIKSGKLKPPQPGTFDQAPPFMAVRDYGKGRIAVMPIASSCFWNDPYHVFWSRGFAMDGVKNGMKGDGARLVANLMTWLSEPSKEKFGGYVSRKRVQPKETGFNRINWDKIKFKGNLMPNCYLGLIGAKSSLSSGRGRPEDFIKEAKRAGYGFIAFAEDIDKMTPEKFSDLKKICQEACDKDFKAYPGFTYLDESGNSWVVFADNLTWPDEGWWSKKYPGRLGVNNPLARGWHFPPIIMVKPKENPEKPYFQGNFKVFSIYTYENGKLVDDSMDTYLRLQKESFVLSPVAVHFVTSPEAVEQARKTGYQTYVRWFDDNMIDALKGFIAKYKGKYVWYRSSFVSDGPIIEDSQIRNMGMSDLIIPGNDRCRMRIAVSSPDGLKEVMLLDADSKLIYRRFLPQGKKAFDHIFDFFHEKQHNFIVTATDMKGKKAVGWCNWTKVQENSFNRCSDNFNTMPRGKWWGAPEKMQNIRGFENYLAVRNFEYCGTPIFVGLKETSRPAIEFYPYLSSRFAGVTVCTVDDHYPATASGNADKTDAPECAVQNEYIKGKVKYTFYRCWQDSPQIELVEGTFTAEKDFDCKYILVYRTHGRPYADCFSAVLSDGTMLSGKMGDKQSTFRGKVKKNGFAALYPNDFKGSVGIIPLQEGLNFSASYRENYGNLRATLGGRSFKKGDKLTYKYLGIISHLDPPPDNSFVTDIINALGINGKTAYKITPVTGSVESTYYTLNLESKDYGFAGKITQAKLPINLPVRIGGLNPRWDAGIWYKGMNTLVIPEWVVNEYGERYAVRRKKRGKDQLSHIPVGEDGTGFLQIDTEIGAKDIYIGNLLVSDNKNVRLTLVDTRVEKAAFEVHNPTNKSITCQVNPGNGFTLLGDFNKNVKVPAGSSVSVNIY